VDDLKTNLPVAKPVDLRVARAAKVIGMPLTQAQCADALRRLGLPLTESQGVISVTPPAYRFDLEIEEDLIEEVARMVGYNNLPTTAPLAPISAKVRDESQRSPFAVRRALAGLGYQETINFAFVEERWESELAGNAAPIRLLNPIASQMSVMRSSLLGSLIQVLKFNCDRKADRVRVFELGRIFLRDASVAESDTTVPTETLQWGRTVQNVDFFDVKGDVQTLLAPLHPVFEPATHPAMHPGRCASVTVDGKVIGHVGELHPKWRQGYDLALAPVMFELDLAAVLARPVPRFAAVARQQAVERDIAVVVSESVTHADLMARVWGAETGGLLRNALLFDVYRPKPQKGDAEVSGGLAAGEKSLAVRLTLNSTDASLTEAQIEAAVQAVVVQLVSHLGARLRA
jgi:phenylalanyl-tRNA synthetase beta chain